MDNCVFGMCVIHKNTGKSFKVLSYDDNSGYFLCLGEDRNFYRWHFRDLIYNNSYDKKERISS